MAAVREGSKGAPRKPKVKSEKQLIAAISQDRLQGSEEAIYFVLRGLGVPVLDGPTLTPRLEVWKSEQPELCKKLRSLGLRKKDDRYVIYPRGASEPGDRLQEDMPLLPSQRGPPRKPQKLGPLGHAASLPDLKASVSPERLEELFERLQRPKLASSDKGFQGCVLAEHCFEAIHARAASPPSGEWKEPPPVAARRPSAVQAGGKPKSKSPSRPRKASQSPRLGSKGRGDRMAMTAPAAAFPRTSEAQSPRMEHGEQQRLCARVAEPKPARLREKKGPPPAADGPSRLGRTAQSDLQRRLTRLKEQGDPRAAIAETWDRFLPSAGSTTAMAATAGSLGRNRSVGGLSAPMALTQ